MLGVKNGIWLGELERFGYTLVVVGISEEEARESLLKAYEKTYRDLNDDADPREEYYDDGKSYYDVAAEEMYVREMAFGSVEWV